MFDSIFRQFAAPVLASYLGDGEAITIGELSYEVIRRHANKQHEEGPSLAETEAPEAATRVELDLRLPAGHAQFDLSTVIEWGGHDDWTIEQVSEDDGIFARVMLRRKKLRRRSVRGARR